VSEQGVASVDRALAILAAFDDQAPRLSLAELSARTGQYKSTILRLAASLQRAGYLRRLSDGRFALGPALLRLGGIYQASFDLRDFVEPALKQLGDSTGESTSFYVRDGDERVCLFRVNSLKHRVLHYVKPGTRLPVRTGAAGAIISAFTEPEDHSRHEIRAHQLAVSSTDRRTDTAAVAAPVFDHIGFVGAISLAVPISRFTPEVVPQLKEAVTHAAGRLSRELGADVESRPDPHSALAPDESAAANDH
jgi:DNA-binding IclR family transcriptional regulator